MHVCRHDCRLYTVQLAATVKPRGCTCQMETTRYTGLVRVTTFPSGSEPMNAQPTCLCSNIPGDICMNCSGFTTVPILHFATFSALLHAKALPVGMLVAGGRIC